MVSPRYGIVFFGCSFIVERMNSASNNKVSFAMESTLQNGDIHYKMFQEKIIFIAH